MKRTEALLRRQALKENIEQLKLRLTKVAKVREGAMPAERPQELLSASEAGLQDQRQRFLAALVTSALPVQGRYTYAANARHDGGRSETTYRSRLAIRRLLGTGRYHLEGGLKHVPGITGSAHSQAPPIPHIGGEGSRSRRTRTAVSYSA
jgi:hypothetical protein